MGVGIERGRGKSRDIQEEVNSTGGEKWRGQEQAGRSG
jgi:hypothetical protein